jgi:hypothetical protein
MIATRRPARCDFTFTNPANARISSDPDDDARLSLLPGGFRVALLRQLHIPRYGFRLNDPARRMAAGKVPAASSQLPQGCLPCPRCTAETGQSARPGPASRPRAARMQQERMWQPVQQASEAPPCLWLKVYNHIVATIFSISFLTSVRCLYAIDHANPSGFRVGQLLVGSPTRSEESAVLGFEPVRPAPEAPQLAALQQAESKTSVRSELQAGVGSARELSIRARSTPLPAP